MGAPLRSPEREESAEGEKVFAWMDVGDEGDSGGSPDVRAADEEHLPPPPASIAEVETFCQLLRLAPSFMERAGEMGATELTALCETAARLKYFDG